MRAKDNKKRVGDSEVIVPIESMLLWLGGALFFCAVVVNVAH